MAIQKGVVEQALPFLHQKIGDDKWEFTSGETGEIRQAANSQSGSLDYHESTYYLHSKNVQPCGTASHWVGQDVDRIYFEELKKFTVWVNYQPNLTIDEMRGLKDTQRNALIAWQHGTPYEKLFDVRQTGAKHAKAILDLTGIDIQSAKRPKALDQISTMELFTP